MIGLKPRFASWIPFAMASVSATSYGWTRISQRVAHFDETKSTFFTP
jgi:hypothetical protein